MADLEIRAAQASDAAAMLEIYNWAVLHTTATYDYEPQALSFMQGWLEDRLRQNYPVLIAENNGQLLGYAALGLFRYKEGYRFTAENSIYIAPQYQQQGIGKQLLARLLQAAAQTRQFSSIIAVIDAESLPSIRLHQQFGFVEAGHFSRIGYKFGRWLDVKFLQLQL